MVRRTRNEMRLAELRNLEPGSLHRPVSGSNRGLQDKEIAICSSAFQSSGGTSCSRRGSRLCNWWFFQVPPRLLTGDQFTNHPARSASFNSEYEIQAVGSAEKYKSHSSPAPGHSSLPRTSSQNDSLRSTGFESQQTHRVMSGNHSDMSLQVCAVPGPRYSGARTAFIKLRLLGAAWMVASLHARASAEIRQSAPKPCNTAMPGRCCCRARSDLEALFPGYGTE
jgi:hypothetical protein